MTSHICGCSCSQSPVPRLRWSSTWAGCGCRSPCTSHVTMNLVNVSRGNRFEDRRSEADDEGEGPKARAGTDVIVRVGVRVACSAQLLRSLAYTVIKPYRRINITHLLSSQISVYWTRGSRARISTSTIHTHCFFCPDAKYHWHGIGVYWQACSLL